MTSGSKEYDDYDWKELPDEIRLAAETLGYTQRLWDKDKDTEISDNDWEELTTEQREAAKKLGYNQQMWDNEDGEETPADTASIATATETKTGTSNGENCWTHEDLIDLIRAVKFSNKDASMRVVHNEITTQMSKTESFEFLQHVKLNDVKKVWKKALSGAPSSAVEKKIAATTSTNTNTGADDDDEKSKKPNVNAKNANDDILQQSSGRGSVVKFYTVGDGSVKTLAEEYTLKAAAAAQMEASKELEEELKNYVHCFLDVPADKSGTRPHQALINFNDTRTNHKKVNDGVAGGGSGSKKDVSDGREIVKIQMAAPIPGMTEKTPMLLYNFDRSARTFIHPCTDVNNSEGDNDDADAEDGYDKIRNLIIKEGVSGALSGGGTKAYFYCRITRRNGVGEKDIVSVDIVSGLAPTQRW